MSMIDNLENIQKSGIRQFVRNEKERWKCPVCGEILSVHKPQCLYCQHKWR
jgi:rubrerythrin